MNTFYAVCGKRLFDLALSIPSFICFIPLFLLISIIIMIESIGPVLFKSERVGKGGKLFMLYKFRTMIDHAESLGPDITAANDDRITRFGAFLRKFKIDEMPQIWNVIKGDISVIGPRPELKKYVGIFKQDFSEILKINPGMTDFALIEFRNEERLLNNYLSRDREAAYIREILPQKIGLYLKYAREVGLSTDIKIFFQTILTIIKE